MSSKVYDWIVIGEGIGAEFFLYWLLKLSKNKLNILQISSPLFTSGTINSTGLLIPFGVQKGISDKGDFLVDCRVFMEQWLIEHNLPGTEKLSVEHYGSGEKFHRRYPDALKEDSYAKMIEKGYHLNWSLLKEYLRATHSTITRISDVYLEHKTKSETLEVRTKNSIFHCHKFFSAIGYMNYFSQNNAADAGKIVAGDYCVWQLNNVLKENTVISFKGWNAIQLKDKFIFGATTIERGHALSFDWNEIVKAYKMFSSAFSKFNFPELKGSHSISGFRHKQSKQMPNWGLRDNSYYISGLYKNGFLYANYLGQKCAKLALEK